MIRLFVAAAALLLAGSLRAGPLPVDSVPAPLRPWVPWVLQGQETIACPSAYNDPARRECLWPSTLQLELGASGGRFKFDVEVFAPASVVQLPGQADAWPQAVRDGGRPVAVIERSGTPVVLLDPGRHSIAGELPWREMPQTLSLPRAAGVVKASLAGRALAQPNAQGELWLRAAQGEGTGVDTLSLRVFRRVDDGIPIRATTLIELDVGGTPREVKLQHALLPGFSALGLTSPLPARLLDDGSLRLQARAGTWRIAVEGRLMSPVDALTLPKDAPTDIETWSFAANNTLRLVSLDGAPSVDPRQAGVPQGWQALPAYRLQRGAQLKIVERRRGDPEPSADKLSLDRTLWLDFDGGGFTAHDALRGTIARSWRLEMAPGIALGRVAVDGFDQFITRLGKAPATGLEVRHGAANIVADSRIDGAPGVLPATGWQADFERVSTTLRLPPGWRLLHASGADQAVGSWVSRWTLWDFFFVLLIAAASLRLNGPVAAAALLAALVLTWQMADSMRWAWLVLLAFTALQRARAAFGGRLASAAIWGRNITLAVMVIGLLPLAVREVRQAIYPVLEMPWRAAIVDLGQAGALRSAAEPEQAVGGRARADRPVPAAPSVSNAIKDELSSVAKTTREEPKAQVPAYRPDPSAKVQTGPGLPEWSWNTYRLLWNGPVDRAQTVSLWLQPPWVTRLWTAAALALLALSLSLHAGRPRPPLRWRAAAPPAAAAAVLMTTLGIGAATSRPAQAAEPPSQAAAAAQPPAVAPPPGGWPSQALLDELRERLTRRADADARAACARSCAQIDRLLVVADGSRIQLRLDVGAAVESFIPLPGTAAQWRPQKVQLDDRAPAMRRDDQGLLWVRLPPGVHQLVLDSDVGAADSVQIALPLAPRAVSAQLGTWSMAGVDARGLASNALTLTREVRVDASGKGEREQAPPFVRVTRTLSLDRRWTVATQIAREGPSAAPVVVRIPLIEGEAVTDASVRIEGGAAVLTLGAGEGASFASVIEPRPKLTLQAAREPNQVEAWRLDASPLWHVRFEGLVPVQRQSGARWLPQWQPWPGERVTIEAMRPEGVAGQTLTLDSARFTVRAGQRSTATTALLTLRTSQGGEHGIQLPASAELQAIAIDNVAQPLRTEAGRVTLALHPGAQVVRIDWREPRGIEKLFSTPKPDLGVAGVNAEVALEVPADRWVLATGGPLMGPAVLFWGVALVIAAAAFALARLRWAPIGYVGWLLLGLGVGQASLAGLVVVVGFLLAMHARARFGAKLDGWRFNLMQIGVALWALVSLLILFESIRTGLLGTPEMLVTGNGSSAYELRWYEDRFTGQPPTGWVFSAPLWLYRTLMLVWALWLALAVVRWVRWVWECFTEGRLWAAWRRAKPGILPVVAQPEGSGSGAA